MLQIAKALFALHVFAAAAGFKTQSNAASPEAIAAALQSKSVEWSGRSFNTDRLRETYKARAHSAIWTAGNQLNETGQALVDEFANSYRDGLEPSDYFGWIKGFSNVGSDGEAARLELALSHAFLTLGRDLYSGLTTPSVTVTPICDASILWP